MGRRNILIRPVRDTDLVILAGADEHNLDSYKIDSYMSRGWVGEISVDLAGLEVVSVQDDVRLW